MVSLATLCRPHVCEDRLMAQEDPKKPRHVLTTSNKDDRYNQLADHQYLNGGDDGVDDNRNGEIDGDFDFFPRLSGLSGDMFE